jgi:ubiquitin-protein ligase
MDVDTDKIMAQEFDWIFKNEPTFQSSKDTFTGKVGRIHSGEDIHIRISVPEFYPIIRPTVKVLADIDHPNIDTDGTLALQLLDEWEPSYRLKDVISAARRLFIRSKKSIRSTVRDDGGKHHTLEQEIILIQKEINQYNQNITKLKGKQLESAGIQNAAVGSLEISRAVDVECQLLALNDLLELLSVKFEEADIDQVDFFRLYRKYIKEQYITARELEKIKGKDYAKKTKRPITN